MYAAGGELVRKLALEHAHARAVVGDVHRVQRADAVREARGEIVGKLAPERVVPAELAAARNVVGLERVEILAHTPRSDFTAWRDVRGEMVGRRSAARRARGRPR